MKRILFSIILLMPVIVGAQNLVPNPSFEDTVYCPFGTNQMDAATNWSSFGNSPDYFNECHPYTGFGYQLPNSGNGKIGLVTYRKPSAPSGPNYRELAGVQLTSSTIVGQKYFLSMYINFAFGPSVSVAANKIGCTLSNISYSEFNPPPLTNQAILYTDSIITDSINWIKLSTSFIANGSFSYLMLGNFFDDNTTDTLNVRPANDYSYYYIDDICLSTDSNYCSTWTSYKKDIETKTISISPNPSNGIFKFNGINNADELMVFDSFGRLVKTTKSINNIVNLEVLKNGVYQITFLFKDKIINETIIIQH